MSPPDRTAPTLGYELDAEDEATLLVRYETLGMERRSLTRSTGEYAQLEEGRLNGEEEDSVADEPTRVEADLSHLSVVMDMHDELGRGGMAEVTGATQRT